MSAESDKRRALWGAIKSSVQVHPTDDGRWCAFTEQGLATGDTERGAVFALRSKLVGTPKKKQARERPYLRLCKPCNRRAAEAGRHKCETEGVELCQNCSEALDKWHEEIRAWRMRRRRNQRKHHERKRARKKRRSAKSRPTTC